MLSETDLSGALAGFGYSRSYSNKLASVYSGPNGNNWISPQWPYLVQDGSDIAFVKGDQRVWFDSALDARFGGEDRYTLTHDAVAKTYTLTVTSGGVETYTFHDFTATAGPHGFLKDHTDAYGKTTTVDRYVGNAIERMTRIESGVSWSMLFLFNEGGPHAGRMYRSRLRWTGGGSGLTTLRFANYSYHDGSTSYGSLNDLETVVQRDRTGEVSPEFVTVSKTYYRWYKAGDSSGGEGDLKYVVGPAAYAEMEADGLNPTNATDAQVAGYADHYFEYDGSGRVTKEVARNCSGCGGSGGTGDNGESFTRTSSAHSDAYNNWKWKVVLTKANGNVETVYTNYLGQVMLKELKEDATSSRKWVTYTKYGTTAGAAGRPIEAASPAAVSGYNDTHADLGVTLHASTGLITYTTYGSSTTASGETLGDALGYPRLVEISEGTSGTKIKQRQTEYKTSTNTTGDLSIVPGKVTTYRDASGGGTDTIETTHAYQWYTGGTIPGAAIKERVTTLPAVPTAQNGDNTAATTRQYYDDRGRMTFSQDERGIVTKNTYEGSTGNLTKRQVDVSSSEPGLPGGWTVGGSSPHLDVTTDYEYDVYGRQTQMLGQPHDAAPAPGTGGTSVEVRHATWTVYKRSASADQTWTGRGYQQTSDSSFTLIDPVSITFTDKNGRTIDQIQSKRSTGTGKLTSSDTFLRADWSRWSTFVYDTTGRLNYERTYHTIPAQSPDLGLDGVLSDPGMQGDNFEETHYGYDDETNLRVRVLTPGGTITRTVYDPINRVDSTWVGTQDDTAPLPAADAQWPLSDTTTDASEAEDTTGNGNTATPTNFAAMDFVVGPDGDDDSALVFDGTNDYLTAPHILDPATAGSFSAACWVRSDQVAAGKMMLKQTNGTGGTGRTWIGIRTTGQFYTHLGGVVLQGTTIVTVDTWYHCAVTFDGTTLRLFVNGQLEASSTPTMDACPNGVMHIGLHEDLSPPRYFDGALADVIIWPTALTDTQVQDLYNARTREIGWKQWDPANPGTNMKKLTESTYDSGAAGGNSYLTQVIQFPDGNNVRATEYEYDFRGRRTATIDATNRYSVPTYNNLNQTTKTQRYDSDPNAGGTLIGQSESFFDDRGRVYRTKQYAVNPSTGAVGNALQGDTWYDPAGNVLESVAPGAGEVFTKNTYDNLGRQTRGYTGYDASGDVIVADAETAFNDIGQALYTTTKQRDTDTPSGSPTFRTTYTAMWYDGVGRSIATANYGTNAGSSFTRPDTVPGRSDDVLVTTTAYNDAGEAYSVTDPKDITSQTEFDDMGRPRKQIDNYQTSGSGTDINRTTEYTYTPDSQQATITAKMTSPADDEVTTYVYGVTTAAGSEINANNILAAIQYPTDTPSSRIDHKVNRLGQLIERKDQNGTAHLYEYDALGRPTADKADTLGNNIDDAVRRLTTTYTTRGQVNTLTSHSSTTGSGGEVNQVLFEYNDFGQLTSDWQEHDGAVTTTGGSASKRVQYAYADGASASNQIRPTSITYPDSGSGGRVIDYNYGPSGGGTDKLNRIHAIKDGSTNLVEYKYLGGGRAVVADYTEPNVKLDLWGSTVGTYDGLDRFGRVIDQRWVDYAGSPVDVARLQYGYDRDSLPNFRRDAVAHAAGKGFDELYSRDGLNRLNNYQRGLLNTGNTSISTLSFEQDWSLSQVANWDAFDQDNTGNGTNDLAQTRTHNQVNEITGITNTTGTPWINPAYDAAGNTTTLPKPELPGEGFTASYDAWNRMVALNEESGGTKVAEYEHDARNFRIRKETYDGTGTLQDTFDFYYTSGWQCIEEVQTGTASVTSQFVWGLRYIDDLVCRDRTVSAATTRQYALSDRRFNTVAIVDTSGNVEERYAYTPYGGVEFLSDTWDDEGTGSFEWVYLFQGLRRDQESGLIENRNRVLHPTLGRFLQRDPLGYPDGMNAYAAYHVIGDGVDPSGFIYRCSDWVNTRVLTWDLRKREYLQKVEVGVGDVVGFLGQLLTLGRAGDRTQAVADLINEGVDLFDEAIPNIAEVTNWREVRNWHSIRTNFPDLTLDFVGGKYYACRCGWKRQRLQEKTCCYIFTKSKFSKFRWVDQPDAITYTYGVLVYKSGEGASSRDWMCSCEFFNPNGDQYVDNEVLDEFAPTIEKLLKNLEDD
ncbi:MAG: LamG-like jellyroll fold domain-containing protein [Planctomycetota bacterium]